MQVHDDKSFKHVVRKIFLYHRRQRFIFLHLLAAKSQEKYLKAPWGKVFMNNKNKWFLA